MGHSVCAPGGTSPGLAASSWGLVRPDRRAAPLAVELDSGQEPDSGQELLALNVGSLYFMKQNGKVRGARGVKTDARSTAAGILKAARRHGALGVVRGAAAWPWTATSPLFARALQDADRASAWGAGRGCFENC